MKTLVISDRQPVLRLGLKLLIESHCQSFCLREVGNIDRLPARNPVDEISIIILGLDLEYDKINSRLVSKIKNKFPESRLILYADNIKYSKVLSYFNYGIAAYIPKQAGESELLSCIQSVMDNKKYISSENRDVSGNFGRQSV